MMASGQPLLLASGSPTPGLSAAGPHGGSHVILTRLAAEVRSRTASCTCAQAVAAMEAAAAGRRAVVSSSCAGWPVYSGEKVSAIELAPSD